MLSQINWTSVEYSEYNPTLPPQYQVRITKTITRSGEAIYRKEKDSRNDDNYNGINFIESVFRVNDNELARFDSIIQASDILSEEPENMLKEEKKTGASVIKFTLYYSEEKPDSNRVHNKITIRLPLKREYRKVSKIADWMSANIIPQKK